MLQKNCTVKKYAELGGLATSSSSNANMSLYRNKYIFFFMSLFQETDTGLYVSLNSFLGFGQDHVECNYRKTGNAVYLHIHRVKKEVSSI